MIDAIDAQTLSPFLVVQRVIEALRVPQLVSKWGDAARRSSHIDSVLQHAAEYEEMSRENGAATTLTGLIVYLQQLADNDADMRIPPLGHDAVTLLTYHSAKGLEWPVGAVQAVMLLAMSLILVGIFTRVLRTRARFGGAGAR